MVSAENAVVHEEQGMDCSRRHTRWGLHTPTVEEVPISSVGDADPRLFITVGIHQRSREHKTEQGGGQYAALLHSVDHCECFGYHPVVSDARLYIVMKPTHHPVAIHRVKGFRKVHEVSVEVSPHLLELLLQLASGEDHIDCSSVSSEAIWALWEQCLLQVSVQKIEENADEDLSSDVQQRDSPVVVAEFTAPFLLEEVHNGGIFELLRDFSLVPYLLGERCESVHQSGSAMILNLIRDRVRVRQAVDGGVGAGGGLFESALEMFHPLHQDSCLLSDQRPAVGTEKRGGSFDWRSVDSLGGGEEVLPFVSVRIPLDFLGFARHPGSLHLPQPLLYKATTSVEGCLVGSGRAIYVGFVQMVLLDEQSVDGCIVVIEPVLVLMPCAAEDIQGGELDGVPQLAPAAIHGGVHAGGWKPHLGDDDAVIRPSVGTGDRFCHQHVLLISPPDENVIQNVPVSRPGVHPGRFLPHREAEDDVGQDQAVFGVGSYEKKTIVIEASETMCTQHSPPRGTLCPDAGV
ncbi:unnamed protein product [Schistocephalus solidus]|uniref:Uncharacterized protein n=1 Tax=Schistocephalus solidus TaxID=70667 RepID=A0A183T8X3_SCHSO|nr:unnamed protein product [Schistocephalus solidus]